MITTRRQSLALLPILLVGAVACTGSNVRTANFRDRPDSVAPGDLRGPFTGQVIDSASGEAIAGAMVYATWTFQTGYGFARAAGHEEFVSSTDASGRYDIPRLKTKTGTKQLASFVLIVYKRGFVAYRSDRRFADLGPRRDFAQRNQKISLERWRSEYSHARHLRYVGGGPAIASLTAWEVDDAAAELSGQLAVIRVGGDPFARVRRLVAAQLVSEAQVKKITSYDGRFETGPLGDQPDTSSYSSQHFKAIGRPESFDIAIRLWKVDLASAQKRYARLLEDLPGASKTNEFADRSLRATQGDIFGIGFLDARRGVVVLMTCGQGQCSSSDIAAAIAKKMHENVKKLWPLGGGE